jgi:tRNA(fMet)-specific endonuclease VapC
VFLLDTNACIRLLNNSSPPLTARLAAQTPEDVYLCAIVKAELIYGAYRSSYVADNLRLLKRFFEPFVSLPFDDQCLEYYGRICNELEQAGTPIGPNDLLIAATALSHDLVLVTHNTREFPRVAGLQIEDWEIDASTRSA